MKYLLLSISIFLFSCTDKTVKEFSHFNQLKVNENKLTGEIFFWGRANKYKYSRYTIEGTNVSDTSNKDVLSNIYTYYDGGFSFGAKTQKSSDIIKYLSVGLNSDIKEFVETNKIKHIRITLEHFETNDLNSLHTIKGAHILYSEWVSI